MIPESGQLQIVTVGLQGSGKTTTCYTLQNLIGAKWLNQDEFAHLGKKAKETMMRNVASESASGQENPLIVDRINTLRTHRKDVFGALKTIGVRVVIVWNMTVKDCIGRIRARSFGHKSIKPTDNVAMIVGRTDKEQEPIASDEVETYQIRKVIQIENPMSMGREQVVRYILDGLSELCPEFNTITDDDICAAVSKTLLRERKLAEENASKADQGSSSQQNPSDAIVKEGRYEIALTEKPRFVDFFEFFNTDACFKRKEEFHVTLLFISRSLVKLINAASDDRNDSGHTAHEYRSALQQYRKSTKADIPIKLKYVAKNDRVMAMRVEILDDSVKFFNVVPHVSIAKIHEAEFRESNFLIEAVEKLKAEGREGASEDGRISWIDTEDSDPLIGNIRFTRHGS